MISEGFCLVDKAKIYEYCLVNKTKRHKYCLTDKTICLYNAVKERVLRMNRDILKQIIVDQKEMYLYNPVISRNYDLEDNVNYCFVGVRRTGKSYMMYQKIHKLMNDGIPLPQIIYVNFEDEHLLEIGIEFSGSKGKTYLFLDEIQNVGGCCQTKRRLTKLSISFIFSWKYIHS